MGRIRILECPPGDEPEWVRRAWVERELETTGTAARITAAMLQNGAPLPPFVVKTVKALEVLEVYEPGAAAWYRQNHQAWVTTDGPLTFAAEVCHPQICGMDLDIHILGEAGLQVLMYHDGGVDDEETGELKQAETQLAQRLGLPQPKADALFQELRVFLVTAMICAQPGMGIPGRETLQPPPQLETVYRALSECSRYNAFCAFSYLPDGLRFAPTCKPEHQINPTNAAYLIGTGQLAGLPFNPALWQF